MNYALFIYFFKWANEIKRKVKGKHFCLPYKPFKYIMKCIYYDSVCVS